MSPSPTCAHTHTHNTHITVLTSNNTHFHALSKICVPPSNNTLFHALSGIRLVCVHMCVCFHVLFRISCTNNTLFPMCVLHYTLTSTPINIHLVFLLLCMFVNVLFCVSTTNNTLFCALYRILCVLLYPCVCVYALFCFSSFNTTLLDKYVLIDVLLTILLLIWSEITHRVMHCPTFFLCYYCFLCLLIHYSVFQL